MKAIKTAFVSAFLLLALGLSAHAIITGDNTTAETDPSGTTGLNWDYVYNYKNSSSVAVDPYWILTASHVADDGGDGALTIDSTTYTQQEIMYHDTADLALVRYDKAFPGHYSLFSGTLVPGNPNNPVSTILVGYGNTGTVSSTFWTDSGSGRGTKRWGTQEIDSTGTISYDVGGTTGSTSNDGFWMDFASSDTSYEAGVGVYDSGGGTFVNDGGTWKLAGINTVRNGPDDEFTSSFSISTQDYETWINQTIPEPSTAILGVGMAVLVGAAQRIRMRF